MKAKYNFIDSVIANYYNLFFAALKLAHINHAKKSLNPTWRAVVWTTTIMLSLHFIVIFTGSRSIDRPLKFLSTAAHFGKSSGWIVRKWINRRHLLAVPIVEELESQQTMRRHVPRLGKQISTFYLSSPSVLSLLLLSQANEELGVRDPKLAMELLCWFVHRQYAIRIRCSLACRAGLCFTGASLYRFNVSLIFSFSAHWMATSASERLSGSGRIPSCQIY
jgi:hypothetical protein